MGAPAVVMGDRITGLCPNHLIPGPLGAPVPSPPLPFSAPLLLGLVSTVLIGGKPAAVMNSSGLNTPPHVGLHPADPLRRAEHRAWIEFGSAVLNDIAGFYAAPDEATFKARTSQLVQRFARLEARLAASPWFDGERFSLVDAVFGPVFRYFDVFDEIADFGILRGKPKLARWREALAARPSVRSAVRADYPALLRDFLDRRNSWLSSLQARVTA